MLKRWGKELVDKCYINKETLEKLDMKKYVAKLRADVEAKKVYIVKEKGWSEWSLTEWFKPNYGKLGFNQIWEERTLEYNQLKAKMQFYGWPDFLGEKQGKIFKVELECFSSAYKYMHKPGYADIVLCYGIDELIPNVEVYDLKGILGYQEIINVLEFVDYLYLTDAEFKAEIDKLILIDLDWFNNKTE